MPARSLQKPSNTSADTTLGGLTLGAMLGRGGMSQVHRAITAGGHRVAIKLPRADQANRAAARALVRREFGFLDRLSHTNIVSVIGLARVSDASSAPFSELGIVMEYVGGGDLVSLAGASPRRWLPVATQIARAVDYIHQAGIVHRDLKPRNVLLRRGDVPCLLDFALAAHIDGPAPKGGGTAAYQRSVARGDAVVADDLYAFAVMLYELWIGALPFGRNPKPRARKNWRGFPEFGPTPGVSGLRHLAGVLSDVLGQRRSALSGGIGPLRHALESVVVEH